MKREILSLMQRTRAFEPFRFANRRKALVLHYHRFSPQPTPPATVASVFEEQLAYVTRHYEVVPLSVIVECLTRRAQLPSRTVAITVDDGYRDFYEVALPVLQKFRTPATIFIVAEFVDRRCWIWTDKIRYVLGHLTQREWPLDLSSIIDLDLLSTGRLEALYPDQSGSDRGAKLNAGAIASPLDSASIAKAAERINSALKSMPESQRDYVIKVIATKLNVVLPDHPPGEYAALSWEQLKELSASGIEVGSHSMTHPILTRESNERVRYEIEESKAKIERLIGRKVTAFCYPNGDYERRAVLEARRARYAGAVTCRGGLNSQTESPYELRRVHTVDDFPAFLQGTSGLEQVKQAIRQRGHFIPQDVEHRYGTTE